MSIIWYSVGRDIFHGRSARVHVRSSVEVTHSIHTRTSPSARSIHPGTTNALLQGGGNIGPLMFGSWLLQYLHIFQFYFFTFSPSLFALLCSWLRLWLRFILSLHVISNHSCFVILFWHSFIGFSLTVVK